MSKHIKFVNSSDHVFPEKWLSHSLANIFNET